MMLPFPTFRLRNSGNSLPGCRDEPGQPGRPEESLEGQLALINSNQSINQSELRGHQSQASRGGR